MEGILLVCSSEKGRAYLAELLRQMAVPQIHMAKSGSQARRFLIQGQAPVVIVNTSDAERIGFDAQQARWFELPPDGVTLVPGRDVDKGFFQTGPISIQLRD